MEVYTINNKYQFHIKVRKMTEMRRSTDTPDRIKSFLEENPEGLTIKKMSRLTGASYCTVAQWLRTLIASGDVVEAGREGRAKKYKSSS